MQKPLEKPVPSRSPEQLIDSRLVWRVLRKYCELGLGHYKLKLLFEAPKINSVLKRKPHFCWYPLL